MVLGCHVVYKHTKSYSEAEGQRENGGQWGWLLIMCQYIMWICECGKIQKDMGFKCTCMILVCNYAKNLKYMVFINVSINNW